MFSFSFLPSPRVNQLAQFLSILLLASLLPACAVLDEQQFRFSVNHEPGDEFMHIRLLETLRLAPRQVDGLVLESLSGLAWDADEERLYAVSDNGLLFHLQLQFEQGELRAVQPLQGVYLRDEQGAALALQHKDYNDSEGLSLRYANNGVRGDSELLVSFERRPRIHRYTPDGVFIEAVPLPAPLDQSAAYASRNKMLETLSQHPRWGLLSIAEYPLPEDKELMRLVSLRGDTWYFPRSAAENSAVVGMESLPDDDVLVLERAYVSVWRPMLITLRRIDLDDSCRNQPETLCATETLAVFDSSQGWRVDNFEGLTHYQGRRFLMISDDNGDPMQDTLLTLFELLPDKAQ